MKHIFKYQDRTGSITVETESVFIGDLLEHFKQYLLAVSFHPDLVERIQFLDKEEVDE